MRALVCQAQSLAWLCRRNRLSSLHRRDRFLHVPSRARGREMDLKEQEVSGFYLCSCLRGMCMVSDQNKPFLFLKQSQNDCRSQIRDHLIILMTHE